MHLFHHITVFSLSEEEKRAFVEAGVEFSRFYLTGGDYRLAAYSDVKFNPLLPASALDLPKVAKRERMN